MRAAAASFVPAAGVVIGTLSALMSMLGLYLGRRLPERFGGLWRMRLALLLSVAGLILSFFELDAFFRFKSRQAEQARNEITMMRLYEAAEVLENYESRFGEYPAGKDIEEIGRIVASKQISFFPTRDGWDRPLIMKADPWDYSITAAPPVKDGSKSFPLLKAQSPKPVFPFIGLYPGTVVETPPHQLPEAP